MLSFGVQMKDKLFQHKDRAALAFHKAALPVQQTAMRVMYLGTAQTAMVTAAEIAGHLRKRRKVSRSS